MPQGKHSWKRVHNRARAVSPICCLAGAFQHLVPPPPPPPCAFACVSRWRRRIEEGQVTLNGQLQAATGHVLRCACACMCALHAPCTHDAARTRMHACCKALANECKTHRAHQRHHDREYCRCPGSTHFVHYMLPHGRHITAALSSAAWRPIPCAGLVMCAPTSGALGRSPTPPATCCCCTRTSIWCDGGGAGGGGAAAAGGPAAPSPPHPKHCNAGFAGTCQATCTCAHATYHTGSVPAAFPADKSRWWRCISRHCSPGSC